MWDKKTIILFIILSTFLLSMLTLLASAETNITAGSRSSALYSPETKSFLYQNNANEKLPMASTTKIVTALIAIETLDPDEIIRVPKEAVGVEGSSLYLKENDELFAQDLIYSVLLQSANDAATVLALKISGSIEAFSEKMNERVAKMGVTETVFKNPHGLDSEGHYTTAHDLSVIAAEALSNDTFKKITSTYKYSFSIGDEKRTVINHNKLLKCYDGCIGVKTGYTKRSGRCLVSAAKKNGITLVAVTLNDPNDWSHHKKMLDYGFDNLEAVNLADLDIPYYIPTISSDGSHIRLGFSESCFIKQKKDSFTYSISLPSYITTDVNEGDKIGQIKLITDNQEKIIDIISKDTVKIKKTSRRFF